MPDTRQLYTRGEAPEVAHVTGRGVAREAAARDPAEMWSFAPGLDVQGMLHARLDTRLFRS